jgi:hypothetical protein
LCHDKLNGASTGERYGRRDVTGADAARFRGFALIDLATLALTHGLMILALLRMLGRDDLDREDGVREPRKPWLRLAEEAAD